MVQIYINIIFIKVDDNIVRLSFDPPLNYRSLESEDIQYYTFSAYVSADELYSIDGDYPKLIVNRLTGQAYKVYFNDILIGALGDLDGGLSNIWNSAASFSIPPSKIKDINSIKIKVLGDYELGLLDMPIHITNSKFSNMTLSYFNFFVNHLNFIAIGLLLFSSALLTFIYNISKNMRMGIGKEFLYYAFGSLFLSISILDYITIYYYEFPTLYIKQIFILSLHTSVLLYSLSYYHQFKSKVNLFLGSSLISLSIYSLLFNSNLRDFMLFNNYLAILIGLNILGCFYTCLVEYKNDYNVKFLLLINTTILLDVINFLFGQKLDYTLTFYPVSFFIFPVTVIFLVSYQFVNINRKISEEKIKSEKLYQKSIKDSMTDLYNHQYVVEKLTYYHGSFIIIMLDIDDFKVINDTLGHPAGDFIIINLAKRAKEELRPDDMIGRYGGDEFIITLFDNNLEEGHRIARRLKDTLEEAYYLDEETTINISISMGIYFSPLREGGDEAIRKVDQALYRSKEGDKGSITIFDDNTI